MMTTRWRLLVTASSFSLSLTLWTVGAAAQTGAPATPPAAAQDTPADPETGDPVAADPQSDSAGDIVVTGFRSSLQKALNLKREAIGVRDSIVAEDIGKFPEQNVAESLQRIPGVLLTRDGPSNEGQKVSLRGLGSNYVVTTINSAPVRTTTAADVGSSARNFNYDVFPSELFGRVDVYKTPLASLEEGGIGGNVDLQTPRPFDSPGTSIRYTANLQYNDGSQKWNPRGSVIASATSGNFGVLFGVTYSKNANLRSGYQTTGAAYTTSALGRLGYIPAANRPGVLVGPYRFELDYAGPGANLGSYTREQIDNAIFPRFFRAYGSVNNRERLGATASLQYKTDRLDLSVDGIYSTITDERDEFTFGVPVRESRTTNRANPVGRSGNNGFIPIDPKIDENNNLYGTFANAAFFNESFYYDANTKFAYIIGRGTWDATDNLKVSGQLNYSRSRAEYYQARLNTNIYGVQVTFDPTVDRFHPSITSPVDYNSPASYRASGNADPALLFQRDVEIDTQKTARLVFDYDVGDIGGVSLHARFGGSYVSTGKENERRSGSDLAQRSVLPGGGTFRGSDIYANMTPGIPIGPIPNGGNRDFPTNWASFPRSYVVGTLNAHGFSRDAPPIASAAFTAEENITSLFFETDAKTMIAGRELRANVGIRYSDTRTVINNVRLENGALVPNEAKGGYKYWLPSISLAYDVTDNLLVRGSAGKTITRAALANIARATYIPEPTSLSAVSGNPNLRPQIATGFDAGIEWYFAPGGLLSVGGFLKTLRDTTISETVQVPFSSLGLPASALNKQVFYPTTAEPDPDLTINLSRFSNGGEQKFKGLEFAYQQQFKFLPAPFDGFGVLGSFTRIFPRQLEFVATNGTAFPVYSIPKVSYSVTGYYEKGPFALRASWNYRGKTTGTVNNDGTNLIQWSAPRGYLDATTSYKINDAIELRFDVLNITNTRSYSYYDDPTGVFGDGQSRPTDPLNSGRTFSFGIRGKL